MAMAPSSFVSRDPIGRRVGRLGRLARLALAAGLGAVLGACGGATSTSSPPGMPIVQTVATESGKLSLVVETEPNPPVRGTNRVIYTITDPSGEPQDGLTFGVVPWMPAHGHGTSVTPAVEARGRGVYSVKNVVLFMPGQWELRTTFPAPGDHAAPEFQIR